MTSSIGSVPYHLAIQDEQGHAYAAADITSVTVLTASTQNTAATLTKDPQGNNSKTNPITTLSTNATKFWCGATSIDVIVKLSNGVCFRQSGVTPGTPRVIIPRQYLTISGVPTVNSSVTGTITQYVYPQSDGSLLVEHHYDDVVIDTSLTATNAVAYGGTLVATVPDGESGVNGIAAVVKPRLDDAQSQYANDATPEGTVGFGIAAKNDAADVGGTDANDDNLLGTGDYVMAAYVAANVGLKEAEGYAADGTVPIYANLSIDASELADTTGPNVRLDGWARFNVSYNHTS